MQQLKRYELIALTGRGPRSFEQALERRDLLLWDFPPVAEKRPPRPYGRRNYYPFDAALSILSDVLVSLGPKRIAVSMALPGLQLTLSDGIDRQNTLAAVAIGNEPYELGISVGTREEIEADGLYDARAFVGLWQVPLGGVVKILRERAEQHGVALPPKLAMRGRPDWARGTPAWEASGGGVSVAWEPQDRARAPAVAPLRMH